jgi:DNA-binding protein YbaB
MLNKMFGQLKDLKKMQSQAKEIQKSMAGKNVEVEKDGNTIVMDGNQEVISVTLNPETSHEELEKIIKNLTNDAVKKVQRMMASEMMKNGGFGF